ncbi:putative dnaJ domain protein [Mycobacterium sp. MAC_080597_8934]|nr:putative dnaJ domain protein [Mycobacterium sp. MAC_080597_8934]
MAVHDESLSGAWCFADSDASRNHPRLPAPPSRPPPRHVPPDSATEGSERLSEILAAYALLRDPARRADYDREHRVHQRIRPAVTRVTRIEPADEQPPLRAGPVRWHRRY